MDFYGLFFYCKSTMDKWTVTRIGSVRVIFFVSGWLVNASFFASGLSQSSVQGESQKNEKKVEKVFGKLAKVMPIRTSRLWISCVRYAVHTCARPWHYACQCWTSTWIRWSDNCCSEGFYKKKYLKDEENAICESSRIFLFISVLWGLVCKVREKRGTSARNRFHFAYLVSIYIV